MDQYESLVPTFCRHLGVGFQILNDLQDWDEHAPNKLVAGRDAELAKPTILLALALDAAKGSRLDELEAIIRGTLPPSLRTDKLGQLYRQLGIFERAETLVDKCRSRAEALADDVQPEALRRLLYFLIDTVLAAPPAPPPEPLVNLSPILPLAQAK
jgi:geranylgeranyl pyrophosphate synthase